MSHKNKRLFEKAHESPNRQVGGLSLRPTGTGRRLPAIPQPEGWGYFIPAYSAGTTRTVANGPSRFVSASVNPSLPFGRLREATERVRIVG